MLVRARQRLKFCLTHDDRHSLSKDYSLLPIRTKSLLDDGVPRDTCGLCVVAAAAAADRVLAISAEGRALYSRW